MNTVEKLTAATRAIWHADPKGAARLAGLHRPPSGDMPKRLYANFDAYWFAGILYQLREGRRTGELTLEGARDSAALFARYGAARLKLWGFDEESALIDAAAGEIKAAGEKQLDDLLQAIIVLVDTLNAWIDATIPWAALGDVAPVKPGEAK
ncbi:MAG: hypothetical protein BGO82_13940 [Devosia sp. 67-54]|uniref:hypothetical protein n=1 Tax=unclassified Devosia TaxID=196773 RepID=UPI000958FE01|nr:MULTISPECIES: hypothetical protein [unclassified Devosia]MBN9306721.1 hypothetical protein [Devosia sp.]OJX15988.1 MAG: hypothetical protein BGO82_13940 [Devosia sp. 67-54]